MILIIYVLQVFILKAIADAHVTGTTCAVSVVVDIGRQVWQAVIYKRVVTAFTHGEKGMGSIACLPERIHYITFPFDVW